GDYPNPCLILKGRIRLTATTPEGQEKVVWYLGDGCLINEVPVFAMHFGQADGRTLRTHFNHICVTDSLVGSIPFETMLEAGRADPELLLNIISSTTSKLSLLANDFAAAQLLSQRARLFRFLHMRVIPGSTPPRVERDIRIGEMASLLCMHRISLYKVLEEAKADGILDFDAKKKQFTILDPDRFYLGMEN
ncbi:MAG: Crp/Fnr family transcriptional regulator, partial [Desulfovibrionaceae bacterium]|nr:Crp/Fnr family transcriptional regulator [Desulfovibrionaceae bacterium]